MTDEMKDKMAADSENTDTSTEDAATKEDSTAKEDTAGEAENAEMFERMKENDYKNASGVEGYNGEGGPAGPGAEYPSNMGPTQLVSGETTTNDKPEDKESK